MITSPSNPRVKAAMKLRRRRQRRRTGLFLAEGRREVRRALEAGLTVRDIFTCGPLLGESLSLPDSAPVHEVAPQLFVKMTYRDDPEGVLAVIEPPDWTLEQLPPTTDRTRYLVAVGPEKPGNLGAMVRTAEASGCDAVLCADVGQITIDVFNPNSIRASTGAVFGQPTINCDEQDILDFLSIRRFNILASTPNGKTPYTAADYRGPLAIVIGPEDRGLSDPWLMAASQRVSIPVHGRLVDSLNASNAAAVLLYEALRASEVGHPAQSVGDP